MTRPTNHISYGPGKFEGESCIARFAYHQTMDGAGDPMDCTCEETLREANAGEYDEAWECADDCSSRVQHISGPFDMVQVEYFERMTEDQMCQDCIDTLLKLARVDIEETASGFVYASA